MVYISPSPLWYVKTIFVNRSGSKEINTIIDQSSVNFHPPMTLFNARENTRKHQRIYHLPESNNFSCLLFSFLVRCLVSIER